ncbi:hypothetical protein F5146DRAFT_1006199 [Armillaria mellea]|nr:hypothetical protein F5146DRAFT_1006199 [Armillaria mellea]
MGVESVIIGIQSLEAHQHIWNNWQPKKSRAVLGPKFKKWAGQGAKFRTKWKEEMLLYLQNQFPYNAPIDEGQLLAVMKWFEGLIDDPDSQLLLHITLKGYAVQVNSMPEEQTVLTMTAVTQIGQYYTNQHNACIHEEKGKKAANIKFSSI